MASILQAVRVFGPKLVYNRTATTDELSGWISGRTGLTRGQVRLVLSELQEAIVSFATAGTPVVLEGIGRVRPTIARGGRLHLRWLPDRRLRLALANVEAYRGTILNRGNIRLADADYKVLWDAAFPDDPLEVGAVDSA